MNWNDHGYRGNQVHSTVVAQHLIQGVASILDFRGVLLKNRMNDSLGHNIDAIALRNDWRLVGQEMYSALNTFQSNTISRLNE